MTLQYIDKKTGAQVFAPSPVKLLRKRVIALEALVAKLISLLPEETQKELTRDD